MERGADGIKLPAVMGRDMYEATGAAAGIGIEEGRGSEPCARSSQAWLVRCSQRWSQY